MRKRKLALIAVLALSVITLFSGCDSKEKKMKKAEETIKQTLTEKYKKDFEIIDLRTYKGGVGTGDTIYFGYAYDPEREGDEKYSTFYVETNGSYKTTKDQYQCMLLQRPLNAAISKFANRDCTILTNIRTDYEIPVGTIKINAQTVLSSQDFYYDVNMIVPQAAPGNIEEEINSIGTLATNLSELGFKGILYVIYSEPTYVDTVYQFLYHNLPSSFQLDYGRAPVDIALDFADGGDHSNDEIKRQILEDLS